MILEDDPESTVGQDVIEEAEVRDIPTAVAVHPNGNLVFVTNQNDGTVSVYNVNTKAVVNTTVGAQPTGIAVSPDGARVYVVNKGDDTLSELDGATGSAVKLAAMQIRRWCASVGASLNRAATMAKRTPIRSASGPLRCSKCGTGRLERETTVKGGTTTVKWRCHACEAVFPARPKVG